mmetsp:Transcript_140509/g.244604  ORF Transcript_140509/g.244604 Transcript_140509/m.244604 type:complete len:241 (-) Transcript_140509:924-1646(-)
MYPTFDTVQYQYQPKAVHPAKKLYMIYILLTGLGILMSFIAVFVPWVQKYVGGGTDRYFVYPFKLCIQDMRRSDNYFTCSDLSLAPTGVAFGNNSKCHGLFLGVIISVFLCVILNVVNLLLQIFTFTRLVKRPLVLHYLTTALITIFGLGFATVAWILFIIYAEEACDPANTALFPVGSYSYGFICQVASSIMFILATFVACAIVPKIKTTLPTYQAKTNNFPVQPEYVPSVATTPYMMY